jgi:hypothetical protein
MSAPGGCRRTRACGLFVDGLLEVGDVGALDRRAIEARLLSPTGATSRTP